MSVHRSRQYHTHIIMHHFKPLAVILLLIGPMCATAQVAQVYGKGERRLTDLEITTTPRTHMTVRQARKALREAFTDAILPASNVKIDRHGFSWVEHPRAQDTSTHTYTFAKIKKLSVENQSKYFHNLATARIWVDALLTLQAAEMAPDTEDADFSAFTNGAKVWLLASPKPEMPDEARAYKALAEDSFKRKDYTAALDAYCDALDRHPMWPEGHYNAALLAAEAKDYELAAHHMRRYLVLAPDAKDASASKDKFLLWQLKAKAEVNAAFIRPNPSTTPKASPSR